jgi:hypothetical protein
MNRPIQSSNPSINNDNDEKIRDEEIHKRFPGLKPL